MKHNIVKRTASLIAAAGIVAAGSTLAMAATEDDADNLAFCTYSVCVSIDTFGGYKGGLYLDEEDAARRVFPTHTRFTEENSTFGLNEEDAARRVFPTHTRFSEENSTFELNEEDADTVLLSPKLSILATLN